MRDWTATWLPFGQPRPRASRQVRVVVRGNANCGDGVTMRDRWKMAIVCSLAFATGLVAVPRGAASQEAESSSDSEKQYASVFCDSGGITLRWYSNEIETVVDEAASDCRVDNRTGVVWYRDSISNLKVYDHASGDTTTVVEGLPSEVDFGVAYYNLKLVPEFDKWLYLIEPTAAGSKVRIKSGPMRDSSSLSEEKIRAKTSVTGNDKFEELAVRAVRNTPEAACGTGLFAACRYRSTLDDPPERIDGVPRAPCVRDQCGRTSIVPNTRYLLVTTTFECGDVCDATKKLYDPETEKFLDPETGESFDDPAEAPVWKGGPFSPDGEFYLQGNAIKKVGEGTLLEVDEGEGAGWLQGSNW